MNELTSSWFDIYENKVVYITVKILGDQKDYKVELIEVLVEPHFRCYFGDWEKTNEYDNIIRFHLDQKHYRLEVEKAFIK